MYYVGIDDTDVLESPGTNQLARHLVQQLAGRWRGTLITRHQLLSDPRIPCTRKNGCVAIAFEPQEPASDAQEPASMEMLADRIGSLMVPWCPVGSDPGLCVAANSVPQEVTEFGLLCQRQVVTQSAARQLARRHGILLRGLGGTQDGVIGALAAIGLLGTHDDGRVIHVGGSDIDHYHVSGIQRIDTLDRFGVDEVRQLDNGELVNTGVVDVGKRLRPNYRAGKVVLFVAPSQLESVDWDAARVL